MPLTQVAAGDTNAAARHNEIYTALKTTTDTEWLTWAHKGADLASAAALSLGGDGVYFDVTGTTGITSISSRITGTVVVLQFDGALTITHNATSLALQGAANYTTVAGDILAFISEGSGNWREVWRRYVSAVPTGFAAPALTLGTSNAAGSATTAVRTDATILAFDATAPTNSAVGDAAAVGVATAATRRDHVHGRESFATPAIVLGTAAAAGAATTPIRSDSTIVAFDATVPVTQASADAAATGSATVAARRDHRHGMPTISSVVKETGYEQINTIETTTSTSMTDLATVGPDVTMTAVSGDYMDCFATVGTTSNNTANTRNLIAPKLDSDATSIDDGADMIQNASTNQEMSMNFVKRFANLTAASHTVKMQYMVAAGTGSFSDRKFIVYRGQG